MRDAACYARILHVHRLTFAFAISFFTQVLDNMEAELRSLLNEKREWEKRILATEGRASRRGSCSGIVVTSGGANYKSGNIKMGPAAPTSCGTSDLFRHLTKRKTSSCTGDAPSNGTSDRRSLQAPKRSPSFLNRFSMALASENDASQSQTTIRNVSVRRQSAISVLSSDGDDDDEDLSKSLSILDISKSEDGEEERGSGRGWHGLRESFSTSVSNLLVNLNSEGGSLGNSLASSMASSRSFLKVPSHSNLEITLQKQLRHLQSERNSATKKLDAQLQEAISAENELIKKQVMQTDILNDLRLRLSDLKITRNLAKSKAQDKIIDLQTQISKLTQSIDEKVSYLQEPDVDNCPNKALRKEEKRLRSELHRISQETEALQGQCSQPRMIGTIHCALETS